MPKFPRETKNVKGLGSCSQGTPNYQTTNGLFVCITSVNKVQLTDAQTWIWTESVFFSSSHLFRFLSLGAVWTQRVHLDPPWLWTHGITIGYVTRALAFLPLFFGFLTCWFFHGSSRIWNYWISQKQLNQESRVQRKLVLQLALRLNYS